MGLFNDRSKNNKGQTIVPAWFMRQAGRYHSHYQNIKKNSDFMTMCKDPKLATEVTMGPIEDFNFDAAILFSDLLFPLEQMGMGLSYESGPPTLAFRIETLADIQKLKLKQPSKEYYNFQKDACHLIREKLNKEKTLLGFVGAPFTLYTYAVEGSHKGELTSSKRGFFDGRFIAFMEILLPDLLAEMLVQAEGGADAVCLFDTAAGELMFSDFEEFIIPRILHLTREFKKHYPNKKIVYYSKLTHLNYLEAIAKMDETNSIDTLGVDWRMDLSSVLLKLGHKYFIQGNIDPSYLHLPWAQLEKKLAAFYATLKNKNVPMDKWIFGLGHGVLQQTPEENVKKAIEYVHANFTY
jgi:uroporphyrinogen decarboxylase